MRLHRTAGRDERRASFTTFLFFIARNRLLNELRRASVQATDEGSKAVIAHRATPSVRHRGAFVRNLAAAGVTDQPQVLTAAACAARTGAAPGRGDRGGR